jgi:hypothetical protein
MTIPKHALRDQGINYFVFETDAVSHINSDRAALLRRLIAKANNNGLAGDRGALAFMEGGKVTYYGDNDVVNLKNLPVPQWTHKIDA